MSLIALRRGASRVFLRHAYLFFRQALVSVLVLSILLSGCGHSDNSGEPNRVHVYVDGKTRLYGDENPSFTLSILEGVYLYEGVSVVNGAASYGDAEILEGIRLETTALQNSPVGEYPVVISIDNSVTPGVYREYQENIVFHEGVLTVEPAPLYVKANPVSITLTETEVSQNPEIPTYSVSGLVPGDTEDIIQGVNPLVVEGLPQFTNEEGFTELICEWGFDDNGPVAENEAGTFKLSGFDSSRYLQYSVVQKEPLTAPNYDVRFQCAEINATMIAPPMLIPVLTSTISLDPSAACSTVVFIDGVAYVQPFGNLTLVNSFNSLVKYSEYYGVSYQEACLPHGFPLASLPYVRTMAEEFMLTTGEDSIDADDWLSDNENIGKLLPFLATELKQNTSWTDNIQLAAPFMPPVTLELQAARMESAKQALIDEVVEFTREVKVAVAEKYLELFIQWRDFDRYEEVSGMGLIELFGPSDVPPDELQTRATEMAMESLGLSTEEVALSLGEIAVGIEHTKDYVAAGGLAAFATSMIITAGLISTTIEATVTTTVTAAGVVVKIGGLFEAFNAIGTATATSTGGLTLVSGVISGVILAVVIGGIKIWQMIEVAGMEQDIRDSIEEYKNITFDDITTEEAFNMLALKLAKDGPPPDAVDPDAVN